MSALFPVHLSSHDYPVEDKLEGKVEVGLEVGSLKCALCFNLATSVKS